MTEENTRLVVAGSQYLVRYLTMTLRQGLEHSRGIENLDFFSFLLLTLILSSPVTSQFATCHRSTKLLSEEEARSVMFCLLYKHARLSPLLEEFQAIIGRKRRSKRLMKFPLIKRITFNNAPCKVWIREICIFLSYVFD